MFEQTASRVNKKSRCLFTGCQVSCVHGLLCEARVRVADWLIGARGGHGERCEEGVDLPVRDAPDVLSFVQLRLSTNDRQRQH